MRKFNISFRKMTDLEFNEFFNKSVLDYSKDLIKSGMCTKEDAFESSKNQFTNFLPNGNYTDNNYLNMIVNNENKEVGVMWFNKYVEAVAFVGSILIYEEFRNNGYGKQALLLLDEVVKEKGFNKILLHVFKYNTIALNLYTSLGYENIEESPSGFHMVKVL